MPRRKKPVEKIEEPEDTMGRADILLQRAIKRGVENSKDPAILALYGRFGNTINTLIADFCGPYEKRKGAKA